MAQKLVSLSSRTDLEEEEKNKTRYVVAHNGRDIYHAVELFPDLQVATGQKYLEVFDTKEDAYSVFNEKIMFATDIKEAEEAEIELNNTKK